METVEKINTADNNTDSFSKEIIKGLSSKPKRIPSKFLYNQKGDELFQQIMKLPEYYLTDCEREILDTYKEEILRICCDNEPFKLIDLGAGDGSKTEILIQYFLKKNIPFEFIAIDISNNALNELLQRIKTKFPSIQARGINAEYSDGLEQLQASKEKKLLLFLGSNLGNFDQRDAVSFLSKIKNSLNHGDMLLLGLDLKKDPQVILNAYSDNSGITAEFNYNLLKRINEELEADFKIGQFLHQATYDPITGEVKSFLISNRKQTVTIQKMDKSFVFEKWEALQTECSNKYDAEIITNLADESGFKITKSFFDSKGYFTDTLWIKS